MPTKWRFCSLSLASRRRVSWKCALPPSMIMSPSSSSGANSSITASVAGPALTMMRSASRALERGDELLRGLGRDEVPLVAELVDHGRGAGGGPVVQGHGVSVPGEVAGQVPAHHAEAGHADLRRCLRHVLRVSSVLYSRCPVTATMPLGPPRGARESRRWRGRRYATGVSRWFGGCCGRSSMVELQPSKLVMRVRFPSPALVFSSQVSSRPAPLLPGRDQCVARARATYVPHRWPVMSPPGRLCWPDPACPQPGG